MSYRVLILPRAQKELERLQGDNYERVKSAILALAQDPRPPGCKKLSGRDGWRVRQGDYRAIYEIDDGEKTVTILKVRHRREAYE